MANETFWQHLDELVATHELVIDRPAGSLHPSYRDLVYPYDYGYLKGTLAMDQGGIDVWRGSQPGQMVTAVICTVDLDKKDAELKILLGCTPAEALTIQDIHNNGPQAGLLLWRGSE
jgi:inorganic pyrophosphatase